MIHFLISHSISLYCQTERVGTEGTDRDMSERGTLMKRKASRKSERNGWQRMR